jgi:hypothetical protein
LDVRRFAGDPRHPGRRSRFVDVWLLDLSHTTGGAGEGDGVMMSGDGELYASNRRLKGFIKIHRDLTGLIKRNTTYGYGPYVSGMSSGQAGVQFRELCKSLKNSDLNAHAPGTRFADLL